ncbi:MAG: hypothetical protein JWP97_685 [Labilithrix sp.]|nr:hypothetical protein [Labilithrix sp.]
MVRVGLCGFTIAIADYPVHFPVVEVQQTFYEPPADATMQRWIAATPRGFEFTVKAWQLITHEGKSPTYRRLRQPLTPEERETCGGFRDSAIVRRAFTRTLACAKLLGATAVLFQCPASFKPDAASVARLRTFFRTIAGPLRPAGVRYLWEPRGPAWSREIDLARSLCAELDLVHVIDPFVDPPHAEDPAPAYFRLHGITGARHVYSDAELARLLAMTPDDAYVMFNNIPRAGDAKRFLRLLGARRVR